MSSLYRRILITIGILLVISGFSAAQTLTTVLDSARHYVNNNDPVRALPLADSAINIANRTHDTAQLIRALGVKGKALYTQHHNKEAMDKFFEALRLCKLPRDKAQIAFLYAEIGYAYNNQKHFKEAAAYYYKELALRKELDQYKEVCNALINISANQQNGQAYDSAITALREVKEILATHYDTTIDGYYYTNLGALLQITGKPDSAALLYQRALDVWNSIHKASEIFKVTYNLGYLEYERKHYSEALRYYHLSEASATRYGMTREIAHVYGTIAETYATTGNYRDAYNYLFKYAMLNDSLSSSDFNNYMARLDKQFQSQENARTIQEQQLRLKAASLAMEQQHNRTLLIVLTLITALFTAAGIFVYTNFRSRVQKEVEKAKNRFFANVAHELRTPLSMIQGPVNILRENISDPSLLSQLDIAERNTIRLGDLVTQMLDISRIDAGRYTLQQQIGDLATAITEVLIQFQTPALQKGLTFNIVNDVPPGNYTFDRDALEKILGNLVGNAIKYTPANGNIGADISLLTPESASILHIRVWDTGPGIPADARNKIFDRFYRSSEQAGQTKGAGIGLALVRELTDLHHGTLSVDSEPGKGSVFTVALPLQVSVPSQATGKSSADMATILLVEDDADILHFNSTLLSANGYTVITATNGADAQTSLTHTLPDLVITDLAMPGMDGLELLHHMRTDAATNHIPAIVLTAKNNPASRTEGLTQGAQVYLTKPFIPGELLAVVHSQLQIITHQKEKLHVAPATPTDPPTLETRFAQADPFTRKCYELIIAHLNDTQLSVEMLAGQMNVNRSHFQRKIKVLSGYSPSELIRTIRLEHARGMLLRREGNITETAYATGFTSQSYFTRAFTDHFGYPPSQLLKQ